MSHSFYVNVRKHVELLHLPIYKLQTSNLQIQFVAIVIACLMVVMFQSHLRVDVEHDTGVCKE